MPVSAEGYRKQTGTVTINGCRADSHHYAGSHEVREGYKMNILNALTEL